MRVVKKVGEIFKGLVYVGEEGDNNNNNNNNNKQAFVKRLFSGMQSANKKNK